MMRVLLIEDDPEMTRIFSLMAKSHGFLCRPTASGKEGLALSRAGKFDIIVLAFKLPDLDGLKVLQEIRAARIDTPVLILSTHPVRDKDVASGALGVCECLTKPVSKRQLLDRMQQLTGREDEDTAPDPAQSRDSTPKSGGGVIPTSQPTQAPDWMKSVASQLPPNQGPGAESPASGGPEAKPPQPKEAKAPSAKPGWLRSALSHFSSGKQAAGKPEPPVSRSQESAGGMPSWLREATQQPASDAQDAPQQRRSSGPPAWLGPRSAESSGAHVPRETLPERELGPGKEPRMPTPKAAPPESDDLSAPPRPEPQISRDPAPPQAPQQAPKPEPQISRDSAPPQAPPQAPTPQDSARAAIEKVLAETLGDQAETEDGPKVALPDDASGSAAPAEPRIVASEDEPPEVIRPEVVAPEETPVIERVSPKHPAVDRSIEGSGSEKPPTEVIEPEIVEAIKPESAQEAVAEDQTHREPGRFSAEDPFSSASFVFDKAVETEPPQSSTAGAPESSELTPPAETPSPEILAAGPAPAEEAAPPEAVQPPDGGADGSTAVTAEPSQAPQQPPAGMTPRQQAVRDARVIVLGNEKGGTGKSTTAMHLIVSLLYEGRRVGSIDIDARQGTLTRYIENRNVFAAKHGLDLPSPDHHSIMMGENALRSFEEVLHRLSETCDDIIVDAGGSDSALSRLAHAWADTLITPINDSFLDLDVLAQFDPETLQVRRPSHYATMVWQARRRKAARGEGEIDWIVVRNRLTNLDSRNKRKVSEAVLGLADQFGFRSGLGFTERMIYRQLFLDGLTLLDLREEQAGIKLSLAHVAARQELRSLMQAINPKKEAEAGAEDAARNEATGPQSPAAAQRTA